ncbi:MAG: GGDEF domain-containing protein [Lachnospiraceae bacterium]|nr:GGDEF domain-containing protein [Lachnospiraceae bacterium]
MKKSRQITEKTFVLTAVIGGILLISLVIGNTILSSRQTILATDEAVSEVSAFYLEAMADRRAKTITNLINNNFDQMEKALAFIEEEGIRSQEDLRESIGKVKALLSLNSFAVVDTDNIVYTQYTTYTGGSRHAFLAKDHMEEPNISTVSLYGSSKQLCLAVPTPGLRIMGRDFKACFVQIYISEIVDLLAFEDQGRTYFGLYSHYGENLSGTELGPIILSQNLFEGMKAYIPEDAWNQSRADFAGETEGSITFNAGGVEETLCYVPVEGTDWKMVVLISESVIHDRIRDISEKSLDSNKSQIIFTLVLVLLFAAILLAEIRIMGHHKLEAEKENSRTFRNMANTDSMTGTGNKHAYSEKEADLNRRIRENEIDKLAVLVCDVNGLKQINDTEGHAAGDRLIQDASAMLCEYFNHGDVYRIGGDEFTIILQEKECDTMNEIIAEFNRKVEENIKTKEVVISIGYSSLMPGDKQLHDVFERADQMMYQRKKQLKEMGAPSRE